MTTRRTFDNNINKKLQKIKRTFSHLCGSLEWILVEVSVTLVFVYGLDRLLEGVFSIHP